jgi:hypothetical protein
MGFIECGPTVRNYVVFAPEADGFKGLVRSVSYKWPFDALFGTNRRKAIFRLGDHALVASD